MFWSSQRASQPQTYVTNANSIDGFSTSISTYIAKAFHHALCSTILYTATIQPLYNHYTARGSDVRGVGLCVGAPAERSGESDKWEYAERIVQPVARRIFIARPLYYIIITPPFTLTSSLEPSYPAGYIGSLYLREESQWARYYYTPPITLTSSPLQSTDAGLLRSRSRG